MRAVKNIFFLHPPWRNCPSGGNKFNRRIIARARRCGFPLHSVTTAPVDSGGAGSPSELFRKKTRRTGAECPLMIWDSLLMARYPLSDRLAEQRCDAFLMHYLPSLDPGLEARVRARALEDRIAGAAGFFIATGRGMAAVLRQRYPGVETFVCEPGVDAVFRRRRRPVTERVDRRVHLLTVANLVPAKGYRELAMILRGLTDRGWMWHIVGSLDADAAFAAEFMRCAADMIESGHLRFHRNLASGSLARLMSSMDVFVSASRFESYGMALAEAVAAGLPVVATAVGEASRIVAGVEHRARLIPVGAWDAFRAALTEMMAVSAGSVETRRTQARPRFRGWDETFADFAAACRAGSGAELDFGAV